MCDIVKEIAEAERAEGIEEGKRAFASTLKEKFQLDEQAAEESMRLY